MKLSLGAGFSDVTRLIARWGAELRSTFFLGDEDFVPEPWSFDQSQLATNTAGVTFSDMELECAWYRHVGKECLWSLSLTVTGSADYADLIIPAPPPKPLLPPPQTWNGYAGRVPAAFGSISPCQEATLGAVNLTVAPVVSNNGANNTDLVIAPSLTPLMTCYTNAGKAKTTYKLAGLYFTLDLPRR